MYSENYCLVFNVIASKRKFFKMHENFCQEISGLNTNLSKENNV